MNRLKKTALVLPLLALVFTSCEKDLSVPPGCIDEDQINQEIFCTADYNPVCGCDGQTYSNACVATNHGGVTSFTNGPCGSQSTCENALEGKVIKSWKQDCDLLIKAENGDKFIPLILPEGISLNKGEKVRFSYNDEVIFCGTGMCHDGKEVEITCLEKI